MEGKLSSKGWKHLILFVLPYLLFVGSFQYLGIFLLGVENNMLKAPSLLQSIVLAFLGAIGTFLVLFIFMKYVDRRPFIDVGFRNQNIYSSIFVGLLLGFFALASGLLISIEFEQLQITQIDFSSSKILQSIVLFLIIAITEETLFRGYVLRNLTWSFGPYIGLIVSAILFALMHGFNPNINLIGLLNLFLAGLLLGLSYLFNKNLWLPISLHFSWNFFQSLFGYNVSGQNSYSLIEFKVIEANLVNGGDFGFEGSIFATVIQILLIALIYFYYRKVYGKTS
ncbi:CPBP family intramembrane glutamic endopeptidase [Allomuricauda sp. SCSIO 65647]|uniref:CPBP family intramembrane glutamic endopeptidase n=1 Tax=Allomuricauda sp. SCSIO 65647 TaxID=2908843 RepID=UPI001F30D8A8|nr:type II CAAX endopeptidase family protein [Muricauda sp. SCSIO 65647]UJH66959.1 CPBP family intramembrane metalloprotease [Muricauda sp. SCSIO 65647]